MAKDKVKGGDTVTHHMGDQHDYLQQISARTEGAGALVSGWQSKSQDFSFSWGALSGKTPEFVKVVEIEKVL